MSLLSLFFSWSCQVIEQCFFVDWYSSVVSCCILSLIKVLTSEAWSWRSLSLWCKNLVQNWWKGKTLVQNWCERQQWKGLKVFQSTQLCAYAALLELLIKEFKHLSKRNEWKLLSFFHICNFCFNFSPHLFCINHDKTDFFSIKVNKSQQTQIFQQNIIQCIIYTI